MSSDEVIMAGRQKLIAALQDGERILAMADTSLFETTGSCPVSPLLNFLVIREGAVDRRAFLNEAIPILLAARTTSEIERDPRAEGFSAEALLGYFQYLRSGGDHVAEMLVVPEEMSPTERLHYYYELLTIDLMLGHLSAGGHILGLGEAVPAAGAL